MSFSGLLELFRIENAKKYLENSDLTIKEIAFLTGYSNEYTFIRAFNRVVGETPGKYKSQIDV
jgi:AraC-like DNA-binding protein